MSCIRRERDAPGFSGVAGIEAEHFVLIYDWMAATSLHSVQTSLSSWVF